MMKHKKHFITIFFVLIFSIVFLTSSNAQPVFPSSLTLNSQSSVDSWGDYFETHGYTIMGGDIFAIQVSSDITDLTPLHTITSVQGNFEIHDNAVLTNLDGLENITSVGGELYIANNILLENLDGLAGLSSVDGNIIIQSNAALTTLDGLGSLTSVGGAFAIDHNAALENLVLGSLVSVVGNLVISSNDALTNTAGTGSLISIGGVLEIAQNDALTDLDGLENLSSVGGNFIIQVNAALTNLDGLESLSSIGGNLQINNNAVLTNLDGLGSLTSVDGTYLYILYNTVLTSFCGLYPLLSTQETIHWDCDYNGANPTVAEIIAGGPCTPLPVELISFTASTNNSIIELHWKTATEVNNYGFEIERNQKSTNGGETWTNIGFVCGHGNSNTPKYYSFVDKDVINGKYYYQLKQIDNDGKFNYSSVIDVTVGITPSKFDLIQNYPNPFNPITTIGFGISEKSNVRLSVHNLLGEEIGYLINEEKESGYHSVDFNANNLPSGVYFYQLQAGDFIATKKMVLMK